MLEMLIFQRDKGVLSVSDQVKRKFMFSGKSISNDTGYGIHAVVLKQVLATKYNPLVGQRLEYNSGKNLHFLTVDEILAYNDRVAA